MGYRSMFAARCGCCPRCPCWRRWWLGRFCHSSGLVRTRRWHSRTLLVGIAGTMVTVIALLLGLTVVALQLSSTQFSPRLLRNFLRDRPNQIVLSVFVATFAYSAAGLYTVGVSGGSRSASLPRLAVSGALVLLFVSLGLLVFFADHLVHSIQVDAIMSVVERNTVGVIREGLFGGREDPVGAGVGRADRVAALGVRAGGAPWSAACGSRAARRLCAAAAPSRRTRGRGDDAGVDLAPLTARNPCPPC
jgi:hypothetical protein